MGLGKDIMVMGITGGIVGTAVYMMMPHRKQREIENGMRKAADELQGVSRELGKAIKSIGESMN